MGRDLANQTLRHEFIDGTAGKTAIDLETFRDEGGSDQFVGGNFLQKLVIGGLIKKDQIVEFLLRLSLGPFLRR